MRDLFYLSKTQFNRIKPYFPLSHVVPRVDDLLVISGINYVIKNGPAMEGCPPGIRAAQDLYNRFALEQDGHIQPHLCGTGWQRGRSPRG
jgi:putative transposase